MLPAESGTAEAKSCGIRKMGETDDEPEDAKALQEDVEARDLTTFIEHCHVYEAEEKKFGEHGDELTQVHMRVMVKKDILGLSQEPKLPNDHLSLTWWSFSLQVRNPEINPKVEDNMFGLFHFHPKHIWNGDVVLRGWTIFGDWPCKYSDWEGWGECSTRCGGGTTRLRRRLLLQPSCDYRSDARCKLLKPCNAPLEMETPCNEYPCKFPCELVDVQEAGVCSAECGGGVRASRWRWRGEGCPDKNDPEAIHYEACNPEPCRTRCKLADTWTVVTGCSEACGQGTYRMMRQVLQKDEDDPACQPEWREVKCVRQWCSQLTILRPDRNVLPYPGDRYYVGIAFKLTFPTQKVTLSAPAGYSFGPPGSDCVLHDHDLIPVYRGCKVGILSVDGQWMDPRSITLILGGILPVSEVGRYHFMLPVTNPNCPGNKYTQVVGIGEDPGTKEVCVIPYDTNLWEMQLMKETVSEGRQPIVSLWANGFELHNPQESHKRPADGGKEILFQTTNDAISLQDGSWRGRVIYCSARLEPCPNGMPCPANGICPTQSAGEDDLLMDDAAWTLDDSEKVNTQDGSQDAQGNADEAD